MIMSTLLGKGIELPLDGKGLREAAEES